MYRLISEAQYTRLIIGGYQPDEYADFWGNLPQLDIEAVKQVCEALIKCNSTICCGICGGLENDHSILHSITCEVTKAQAILKQLEGV